MISASRRRSGQFQPAVWWGIAIVTFTLVVFMISRVHQVTDSAYSMLLSQSLLDHRSFALDHYSLPPAYQLETINGHTYYRFPPGTPILSAPFVWILNRAGISAANADGTYNPRGEVTIEAGLAALLMALLAGIFFYTARLLLPNRWSAVVALGGALGTQVYSTASRALWSETWGIFLMGIVVFMLLAHETGKRQLNPVILASLLSWTYLVRPTFAVPIVAITVYLFLFYRPLFIRYALTGAVWLAGFVFYSWFHYGQLMPSYYRADRLLFNVFWTALAGNLVSPARGLLIYIPVLCFVFYLLVRFRRFLVHSRLVWMSLAIIVLHLIAVSGFPHWWAGHSFGPRFTTGLVPWLVLLSILGVRAMLNWREQNQQLTNSFAWRAQLFCGGLLLFVSVFINTLGATSHATWLWNMRPRGIDEHPDRLWDWRQPQFLAGILPFPEPQTVYPIGLARIDFTRPEADKYFWYGWNEGPPDSRWTESKAAMIFTLGNERPAVVHLNLTPYLIAGKWTRQRVMVSLNGKQLANLTLTAPEAQVQTINFSSEILRAKNTLSFELPDAESPQKLGTEPDPRPRGIKINWIQFGL